MKINLNKFMDNMGTLQVEAYNEAINDVIHTINKIDKMLPKEQNLTIHELIEIINGLKIN